MVDRGFSAIAESRSALRELPEAETLTPNDERIGTLIGRYRLLRSLGKGGCGDVYLAEQEEPVRREVALKVIKLGMDTRSVIARFDAERQALAMMDHPNIARVLDAGATTLGRPYFVLELVRGTRITDYCQQQRCHLRQRVELIICVCRAIQHAHQKGIIHRDIKPSNVLIAEQDGVPVPKVIDFGIAKAIDDRLSDDTHPTFHEQLLGTPAYMSPEQAGIGKDDVDTRSDIYSLGALLYELVTGHPPLGDLVQARHDPSEVRRILLHREPQRPSDRLLQIAAQSARTSETPPISDPLKLASKVKGELDWIIMRALEKDRTRRYDTAFGLAIDLQRFLNHEPIAARPPSRLYILRKLIRRNRAVFASTSLILMALIAGLSTSTTLYFKARSAELRQSELRATAEWALQKEAKLRRDAETREKLTEAVALTRQDHFSEAARILSSIHSPPVLPSLDAITALRDVGQWLGGEQRWQEAERCFEWLFEIDKLDPWQTVSLNCQAYGVLLVETDKQALYRHFCDVIGSSHQQITDPDEATRLLKSCLLRPLEPELRSQLHSLAITSEAWSSSLPVDASGWPSIAPCLWKYRIGDFEAAISIGLQSQPSSDETMAHRPTRDAIMAMAYHASGNTEAAAHHLSLAQHAVNLRFQSPLSDGSGYTGLWYDWLFAKILVDEATHMLAEPARSDSHNFEAH
nr:serine/threonine-protein kinase [Haloferula luteola]